jgi:hypothetical protein
MAPTVSFQGVFLKTSYRSKKHAAGLNPVNANLMDKSVATALPVALNYQWPSHRVAAPNSPVTRYVKSFHEMLSGYLVVPMDQVTTAVMHI